MITIKKSKFIVKLLLLGYITFFSTTLLNAQFSVFGGAGSFITFDSKNYLNWNEVSENGIAKANYKSNRFIHHLTNNKNSLFVVYPKWGGDLNLGCFYNLKGHIFGSQFIYNFQTIGKTNIYYTTNSSGSKTINGYDPKGSFILQSIRIPIEYGFDIFRKNKNIMLEPFIGWTNQFNLLSSRFSERIDYFHRMVGLASAGIRFNLHYFTLCVSYSMMVTEFNYKYSDVRLQTINLSLGYVYTFKTKAERQAKK